MPVKSLFRVLFPLILVLAAAGLSAESLQVDYLEGLMEIGAGGSWREAAIGETIPPGASLRLEASAVVELAWGSCHFTLIGAGTFYADSLVSSARAARDWSIRPLVSRKLEALLEGLPERESSAMGARAAEVEDTPGFGWVDETEAAVAEGKELLAAGSYEEALALFREELALGAGEEADTLRYYIGYAHAGLNDNRRALAELERIEPDETAACYGDLVLLKGRLLVEANRFSQALPLFDGYLSAYPGGVAAQEAAYLSAFASYMLGDTKAALEKLDQAARLDPASEMGRAAAALRAGLAGG
jgi:tetratricopeptide (TPR) repeat protein